MIKVGYVNFWKEEGEYWLTKYIRHNFGPTQEVHPLSNPDILLASVFGPIINVLKTKAKCKIFYTGENLKNYPHYDNDELLSRVFDLTIGFKRDDHSLRRIRVPLWIMYYDYYDFKENNNLMSYLEEKRAQNSSNKTLLASLVASHDSLAGHRSPMVNEVNTYGKVICPGRFGNNHPPIGNTVADKIRFISTSKINICPENSSGEGYITEKIFQALEGGTVPLYWAGEEPEPGILNPASYCFCDGKNPSDLKNKVQYLMKNIDSFVEAPMFSENAGMILSNLYENLRISIGALIKLREIEAS